MAGLPRDLPAAVSAAIADADADLERAQDLLTGDAPIEAISGKPYTTPWLTRYDRGDGERM